MQGSHASAVRAPLSEMFDGLEDAVAVFDRDLRLVYVNDPFCALVGWPRPILLGAEPPMPWWVAGDAERGAELMRRLLDGAELTGPSAERVYRHRSGREIAVGIRSSLLRDDAGAVTALVAFARPLEASAEAGPADALRAERDRLARAEEAQRAAALHAASIVHEIGTPLTVIRGHAEMLAEELAGTALEERVRAIQRAAERIDDLTGDLASTVEAPAGEVTVDPEPMDLAALVLGGLADLGRDADAQGVRLRGDLAPSAPVRGDRARLGQVLHGMVGSALRRTPAGSEVRVGLRCGGGWAVLDVDDRGPRLDEVAREALFAPSPAASGEAGIGLALARAVARAHDGEIDAVDQPAGGLLLRLTLPLAEDGPA